ncbi:hypothetical protein Leryth_020738 [Lithospermum erythrorhizon]|nr:hypothetical protein Leryth_020738 [Lithospermum erythrorhizon]
MLQVTINKKLLKFPEQRWLSSTQCLKCLTSVKTSDTPYLLQQSTASPSLILPPGSAITPTPLSHASSTASFQAVNSIPYNLRGWKKREFDRDHIDSRAEIESRFRNYVSVRKETFAAALIIAGPPISMFSIPSSKEMPLEDETLL